jgi:hypothetical protein
MGEVFDRMTEDRGNTVVGRLRGISDDMVGQIRDGTWEALAGPALTQYTTWEVQEKSPFIRKRKRGKSAG